MENVEYVCDECGYAKKPKPLSKVKKLILGLLFSLIYVFGMLFIVLLILLGPLQIVNVMGSALMTNLNDGESGLLRKEAMNISSYCIEEEYLDASCYAREFYKELNKLNYVPASLYSPLQKPSETLIYGGDCKNTAILFVTLMKSMGFQASVDCNVLVEHCVSVVPLENNIYGDYLVVDIAQKYFVYMDDEDDVWNYKIVWYNYISDGEE